MARSTLLSEMPSRQAEQGVREGRLSTPSSRHRPIARMSTYPISMSGSWHTSETSSRCHSLREPSVS